MDPSIPTRPILWNIPAWPNVLLMYLAFGISLLVVALLLYRTYERWRLIGRNEKNPVTFHGVLRFLWDGVFQGKVSAGGFSGVQRKDSRVDSQKSTGGSSGTYHLLVYLGFMMLLITTTMVMLQHDFGLPVFQGSPYLVVTFGSDVLGLGLLIGVVLFGRRRYLERPPGLHSAWGDWVFLGLLALLVIQGFLLEGLRIHAEHDPWRYYSPVGLLVSKLLWPINTEGARQLHFLLWWFHTLTVFIAIAWLPFSKIKHILLSPLSLLLGRSSRSEAAYTLRPYSDIEEAVEKGEELQLGASSVKDLFWTQILELDACTSCGRCQDLCPAYLSGKVLSPKWLVLDTRNHIYSLEAEGQLPSKLPKPLQSLSSLAAQTELSAVGLAAKAASNGSLESSSYQYTTIKSGSSAVNDSPVKLGGSLDAALCGEVMDKDVFWSCTTCLACVEACPVGIDHVSLIVEQRRHQVMMLGEPPAEAQGMLRGLETRGHATSEPSVHSNWHADLEVRTLNQGDSVDVLYWVGCATSSDPRKQRIARSIVKILKAANVDFGILSEKECCTGDPARRLGDELLYQTMAKKTLSVIAEVSCKTILVNCPHCLHQLKNEYRDFKHLYPSNPPQILHHSEFIEQLISQNRLELTNPLPESLTFHDPCYLGRYNDEYDAPREVLVMLGGKAPLVEMERSREKSLCCGAGGGHYFFDLKKGERVNSLRATEALQTGASCVATGCPFCLQMLEDGTKLTNSEDKLKVRDIAELVADSLG